MENKENLKTLEELSALKEEAKAANAKLHQLTNEEMALVSGGSGGTGKDGCWGGVPHIDKCNGCSCFAGGAICTLSGLGLGR